MADSENESGDGGSSLGGPKRGQDNNDKRNVKQPEYYATSTADSEQSSGPYQIKAGGKESAHSEMDAAIAEGVRRGAFETLRHIQDGKALTLMWTDWTNNGSTPVHKFTNSQVEEAFAAAQARRVNAVDKVSEPTSEIDKKSKVEESADNAKPSTEETNAERAQRFMAQQDPRAKRSPDLALAQSYVDVAQKIAAEKFAGKQDYQRAYIKGVTNEVARSLRYGDELGGIAYRQGEVVSLRQKQEEKAKQPAAKQTPSQKAEERQINQRILREMSPRNRVL